MDYIIYTTEGYTETPNGQVCENCQILDVDYDTDKSPQEILQEFATKNKRESLGWETDKMKVVRIIDKDVYDAMWKVVEYLWKDEQKHYEECDSQQREGHIFESLIQLANYWGKDYKALDTFNK